MGAFFFKGFLKIVVHVAGYSLYVVHPLKTDMFDKVIDYLLLLASRNPEDMAGFHINDVSGVAVSIMKLKLINTKEFSRFFRFDQLPTAGGIQFLKALFIDILNRILTKTGQFSYFLICIGSGCQKNTGILVQLFRNHMAGSLERGDMLHPGITAFRACVRQRISFRLGCLHPAKMQYQS